MNIDKADIRAALERQKKVLRPNLRTRLYRLPKETTGWVFHISHYQPPKSTKLLCEAIRANFHMIHKGKQIALVVPEKGHEVGVYNICMRLFQKIEEDEADRLLKRAGM
jgi:hypothetical protein